MKIVNVPSHNYRLSFCFLQFKKKTRGIECPRMKVSLKSAPLKENFFQIKQRVRYQLKYVDANVSLQNKIGLFRCHISICFTTTRLLKPKMQIVTSIHYDLNTKN